ncbi:MAG: type II toxin-antitoxin system HigB family toxin [Mucilaginibacter polytrichastri]|nr:type II toxin-antitoxin system HigB family toxin [Mucilaginibacter polytrichastri]
MCLKIPLFSKRELLYLFVVAFNVLARRTLNLYCTRYPAARTALEVWYSEFKRSSFRNFNELKSNYGNASIVANNRVVFNIKGNDYRLVVMVNFEAAMAYVIWFGTHAEYDRIDVSTIKYKPD